MDELTEQLIQLIDQIGESAKYGQIEAGLVSRIGLEELQKGRKFKEAVKAAKNKLHQVAGAYLDEKRNYIAWAAELESAPDEQARKQVCLKLMEKHASTRERLPILEEFYGTIFGELPQINTVIDLACGFNPLALPWMSLGEQAAYHAVDIYYDMLFMIGKFLEIMPVDSAVEAFDLTGIDPIAKQADLAFLLKTIPCLEQVDKNIGPRLLEHINAKYLVVSFPVASLGGRDKGMLGNYENHFMGMVDGTGWGVRKFEFETELAFIVEK